MFNLKSACILMIKKLISLSIFFNLITVIFFSSNLSYASLDQIEDEQPFFHSTTKKFFELTSIFKRCFECFSDDYDYQKIPLYTSSENSDSLSDDFGKESQIFIINELLYNIAKFLSPSNIINLIQSSKKFSVLKTKDFWSYYNLNNQYITWSNDISPLTVAFSYYWFNTQQIVRSAHLGFPKAIELLEKKSQLRKNKEIKENTFNFLETRNFPYRMYDGYKSRF